MTDNKTFSTIGVTVKEIESVTDSTIVAVMTTAQFARLSTVVGATNALFSHLKAIGNSTYMVIKVSVDALNEAVETNAKAPRVRRGALGEDLISSKTVYTIKPVADVLNQPEEAEYASDSESGWVVINGVHFEIETVPAIEVYENAADTDPERPVFVIRYSNKDGEDKMLTSYGVTNLLRRIIACKEVMHPMN